VKRRRRGWSPDNHAYQHRSPDPTKIERATATSTAALFFLFLRVNNRLFLFLSELMDLFVAGRDQSAADQPNNLAEGHPQL